MADTRTRLPLPEPYDCIQPFANQDVNVWSKAQMHAYSDAENAALRERVKVLEDALRECLSAANDDSLTRWQDAATAARAVLAARKAAP